MTPHAPVAPVASGRRWWGWNTWDARFPACMLDPRTGLAVRISAYSAKANAYTDFPYSSQIRLGPRAVDGSFVELQLEHAGSRLRVRFGTPEPDVMVGDIEVISLGEWGLRFWYQLEVGCPADANAGELVRLKMPAGDEAYTASPVAMAGGVAATTTVRPVGAHVYEDLAEVGRELETQGYYARPPARDAGHWVVFRFSAVEPSVGFVVGPPASVGHVRPIEVLEALRSSIPTGDAKRAAIRDVVGWNTVWDPVNGRPYTTATRAWAAEKFGGWFVWLNDAFYSALLAGHVGAVDVAWANLEAAMSNATPQGNLAGLMSGRTWWVDRSHLPVGAHVVWLLYRMTGDRAFLERAYPVLARAFAWWFEARDGNGNGLLEPGSSPIGDGHFVHSKQAALDEAAMDNSPVYDEAVFDAEAHTLDLEDVALNAQLVLEGETLARIAEELERPSGEAEALRGRSEALAALVRSELWDPLRRVFANRLWGGRFVRSLAPTSFYAMAAGIATPEQAEALVREHLLNPAEFWGEFPVAGTSHDDPAAADNVYWRGRVWPTMNHLVWLGLKRYGYEAEASELAERGWAMFSRGWAERRCFENFNQRTGEGGDSVDSDAFYTWGALLAAIGELDLADLFDLFGGAQPV